jgi:hypothetical protein
MKQTNKTAIANVVGKTFEIRADFFRFDALCSEIERDAQVSASDDAGDYDEGIVIKSLDFDYSRIFKNYCKEVVEYLALENQVFKGLNVEKIKFSDSNAYAFFQLSGAKVLELLAYILQTSERRQILAGVVRDALTPRSGFIPFYPAKITAWGEIDKWHECQWDLIFKAAIFSATGDDEINSSWQFGKLEEMACNEKISSWLDLEPVFVDTMKAAGVY